MSIVLIWNNNMVTTGHSYPGHAALQIGYNWGNTESYVSWIPDSMTGPDGGARLAKKHSVLQDLSFEGCAPDHILLMPEDLDVPKMRAEWGKIKGKADAHYKFYRKNCSNIASRVLKEGSSKGSLVQRHNAIWTPLKVKRLALEMGGKPQEWTWLINELNSCDVINGSEKTMLASLRKRDERHGSNSNASYHAGGHKIAQKVGMMSFDATGGQRLMINPSEKGVNMAVQDGMLFSSGTFNQIEMQSFTIDLGAYRG